MRQSTSTVGATDGAEAPTILLHLSLHPKPKEGPAVVHFLYGYKTYMGGMALMFLAVGSVFQGVSDGTEIDWNRSINDFLIGATVFGAAYRAGRPPK